MTATLTDHRPTEPVTATSVLGRMPAVFHLPDGSVAHRHAITTDPATGTHHWMGVVTDGTHTTGPAHLALNHATLDPHDPFTVTILPVTVGDRTMGAMPHMVALAAEVNMWLLVDAWRNTHHQDVREDLVRRMGDFTRTSSLNTRLDVRELGDMVTNRLSSIKEQLVAGSYDDFDADDPIVLEAADMMADEVCALVWQMLRTPGLSSSSRALVDAVRGGDVSMLVPDGFDQAPHGRLVLDTITAMIRGER